MCQICTIVGHTADRCRHRFYYNYKPPPPKHLAAYVADMELASPDSWLLDSGATIHITADFNNHSVYEGEELIQVGDGTGFSIHHYFSCVWKLKVIPCIPLVEYLLE